MVDDITDIRVPDPLVCMSHCYEIESCAKDC